MKRYRLRTEKVLVNPHDYDLSGEWEPYESYMKAKIIARNEDEAILLVEFPPEISEDNELHTHPISDRRVTVLQGTGEFIYSDGKKNIHFQPLVPGDRVWMPRGTLHTFKSGEEGLLVESVHSPFVPFDHRLCILYPKGGS